jgi:osmotically inducible protein OsmC
MKSSANAIWKGKGIDGTGSITTKSDVLHSIPYSYKTRFQGREVGTSPEELIAAAHAGCFAMKLAFIIESETLVAEELNVNCEVSLEAGIITKAVLKLKARVPGITKEKFDGMVANAGQNCPVSKLLNAQVIVEAELL